MFSKLKAGQIEAAPLVSLSQGSPLPPKNKTAAYMYNYQSPNPSKMNMLFVYMHCLRICILNMLLTGSARAQRMPQDRPGRAFALRMVLCIQWGAFGYEGYLMMLIIGKEGIQGLNQSGISV